MALNFSLLDETHQLNGAARRQCSNFPDAGNENDEYDDDEDDDDEQAAAAMFRRTMTGASSSEAAAVGTDGDGTENSSSKKKRPRTAFTTVQIKALESEFDKCKYLSVTKRVELSRKLGLTQQQLKVWYQNRRTKWKRKYAQDVESVAKQYYSSLGLNTTLRPMFIGDRLWLFNYLTGMPVAGMPPPLPPSSQDAALVLAASSSLSPKLPANSECVCLPPPIADAASSSADAATMQLQKAVNAEQQSLSSSNLQQRPVPATITERLNSKTRRNIAARSPPMDATLAAQVRPQSAKRPVSPPPSLLPNRYTDDGDDARRMSSSGNINNLQIVVHRPTAIKANNVATTIKSTFDRHQHKSAIKFSLYEPPQQQQLLPNSTDDAVHFRPTNSSRQQQLLLPTISGHSNNNVARHCTLQTNSDEHGYFSPPRTATNAIRRHATTSSSLCSSWPILPSPAVREDNCCPPNCPQQHLRCCSSSLMTQQQRSGIFSATSSSFSAVSAATRSPTTTAAVTSGHYPPPHFANLYTGHGEQYNLASFDSTTTASTVSSASPIAGMQAAMQAMLAAILRAGTVATNNNSSTSATAAAFPSPT